MKIAIVLFVLVGCATAEQAPNRSCLPKYKQENMFLFFTHGGMPNNSEVKALGQYETCDK